MATEHGVRFVCIRPGTGLGKVVRALVLLLWFAARASALYFHIGETEKKCFIEEIPDETMVIGAWVKGRVLDRPWCRGGGYGTLSFPKLGSSGFAVCPTGCGPRATSCCADLISSRLFPGNYRTQLYDKQREEYQPATPGLGMFVEVKDPEDKVSQPLHLAEPST